MNKNLEKFLKIFFYSLLFISISSCRGLYNFISHNLPNEVQTYNISVTIDSASSKAKLILDTVKYKLSSKLENIGLINQENGDISFALSLSKINLDKKGEIYELQTGIALEYKNYENKSEKSNIIKNKQLKKGSTDISQNIIDEVANEIVDEIWGQTLSKW